MARLSDFEEANPFYRGCTPTELSRLFKMPLQTVRDSLKDVTPCGRRGARDLFSIKEASRALIREAEDDAEQVRRILRLHHNELPKLLSKEFWLAETHRQKYELTAGELWHTTKIVEWLGEAYKHVRLSLMLMADTVERTEPLTEGQRSTIITMIDATLNDAAERLIRAFKDRRDAEISGSTSPEEDGSDEEL